MPCINDRADQTPRHFILRTLFFVAALFFLLKSQAQTTFDGVIIQADSGERDFQSRSMKLEGHIQIIYKDQHLTADRAILYQDRKELVAEGHVLLVTPTATLGGRKIVMNYETTLGTIYSGFVQSDQVIFEGTVIEKTGEDQYYTTESQYTSCSTCPPAWSFAGETIKAQLGGYAFIKNSVLRFGHVPVLWLPYLIVPLKSERQSGLLTPSLAHTRRGGWSLAQPVFWAISDSQDATLTLQTFETRGIKTLANYRYVLNATSSGELHSAVIRDRFFGQTPRYQNYYPESDGVSRWFFKYRHYWDLPSDWIQRTEFNNASDLQYTNDFPLDTVNFGDPAMETRVSLTKNTPDIHFSIDSSYYVNMLKGNPLGDNRESVHRLPEINLISTRKPLGESGFLFNYELKYTHFARNDFGYDDLTPGLDSRGRFNRQVTNSCDNTNTDWEYDRNCTVVRDGAFNPGTDLIRSGQRMLFEPTLSHPLELGEYFNLTPRLSYREAHYNFGLDDVSDLTRRLLRAEVRLQTAFSRVFGDLENPRSVRYKHEIQPEIISVSVPWIRQPYHPFLGFKETTEIPFFSRDAASDSDLFGDNSIQFDYEDRLFDRNLITYRITNTVTQKSWDQSNHPSYSRLLTWRLSQTYDLYEAGRSESAGQPWSDIESLLTIRLPYFNTYTKINFYPYQGLSDTSSDLTFNDDRGNYLKTGLTRRYRINNDGSIDIKERTEDYLFQLGTTTKYLNLAARVIYNGNDVTAKIDGTRLKAQTLIAMIRPPGNCWGIHLSRHETARPKDIEYRINFDFLFDGKTSTQFSPQDLQAYGF